MVRFRVFYILVLCFVVINLINLGVKFSGLAVILGLCILFGGIFLGFTGAYLIGKAAAVGYSFSWKSSSDE